MFSGLSNTRGSNGDKYNRFEKLSAAARDYVTRSDRVRAFLFMNPMKDWRPAAEASRGRPRDEMI
jgi:hypothetical protein